MLVDFSGGDEVRGLAGLDMQHIVADGQSTDFDGRGWGPAQVGFGDLVLGC